MKITNPTLFDYPKRKNKSITCLSSAFLIYMLFTPQSAMAADIDYQIQGKLASIQSDSPNQYYGKIGELLTTGASINYNALKHLTLFGGVGLLASTNDKLYWFNQIIPFVGVKSVFRDVVPSADWSEAQIGAQASYHQYFNGRDGDDRQKIFSKLIFTGQSYYNNYRLPYNGYINISHTFSDTENEYYGHKKDALYSKFSLGIEFTPGIVAFVEDVNAISDNKSRYWANKIAPAIGIKKVFKAPIPKSKWGSIDVGVKALTNFYLQPQYSNNGNTDSQIQFFIDLGLGG